MLLRNINLISKRPIPIEISVTFSLFSCVNKFKCQNHLGLLHYSYRILVGHSQFKTSLLSVSLENNFCSPGYIKHITGQMDVLKLEITTFSVHPVLFGYPMIRIESAFPWNLQLWCSDVSLVCAWFTSNRPSMPIPRWLCLGFPSAGRGLKSKSVLLELCSANVSGTLQFNSSFIKKQWDKSPFSSISIHIFGFAIFCQDIGDDLSIFFFFSFFFHEFKLPC